MSSQTAANGRLIVTSAEDLPEGPARNIFTASPTLSSIFDLAVARGMSPEAILVRTIAKAIVHTGPHVLIPDYVGTLGSLNLGVMSIGTSGAGKSTTSDVVSSCIRITPAGGGFPENLYGLSVREDLPLGSGEGLEETFDLSKYKAYLAALDKYEKAVEARAKEDPDTAPKGRRSLREPAEVLRPTDRAGFTVDEVAKLAAIARRPDSNLVPTLNTSITGGTLGQTNKSDNARDLLKRAYRMCLTVSAQPSLTGWILTGVHADSGFGGRWVWTPADPRYTTPELAMETKPDFAALRGSRKQRRRSTAAESISIPVPAEALERRELPAGAETWLDPEAAGTRIVMEFGEAAQAEMIWNDANRGERSVLEGHTDLVRAKLSCGLALMHGRLDVLDEDWDVAGELMIISAEIRETCLEAADDAERDEALRTEYTRATARSGAEKMRTDGATKAEKKLLEVLDGAYDHQISGAATRSIRRHKAELDRLIADGEEAGTIRVEREGTTVRVYRVEQPAMPTLSLTTSGNAFGPAQNTGATTATAPTAEAVVAPVIQMTPRPAPLSPDQIAELAARPRPACEVSPEDAARWLAEADAIEAAKEAK